MSEDKKDLKDFKITFAPGALEDLDKIPEADAQEMLRQMQEMLENGTLADHMTPVNMDELKRDSPDAWERITGEKIKGN